jgi:uncharacterized protein (TIGR03066 family)
MLVTTALACALADDKKEKPNYAKLIIGKWEVTKTNSPLDASVGTIFEFSKEGKLTITEIVDGKRESCFGIFTVVADKLQFTLKQPGEEDEEKDPTTIKKLSERELVLEGTRKPGKTVTVELKRLK